MDSFQPVVKNVQHGLLHKWGLLMRGLMLLVVSSHLTAAYPFCFTKNSDETQEYHLFDHEFDEGKVSYDEAIHMCEVHEAHLAIPKSNEENVFVSGLDKSGTKTMWLGIRHAGNNWVYITNGKPIMYNAGLDNTDVDGASIAAVLNGLKWERQTTDGRHYAVCQRDILEKNSCKGEFQFIIKVQPTKQQLREDVSCPKIISHKMKRAKERGQDNFYLLKINAKLAKPFNEATDQFRVEVLDIRDIYNIILDGESLYEVSWNFPERFKPTDEGECSGGNDLSDNDKKGRYDFCIHTKNTKQWYFEIRDGMLDYESKLPLAITYNDVNRKGYYNYTGHFRTPLVYDDVGAYYWLPPMVSQETPLSSTSVQTVQVTDISVREAELKVCLRYLDVESQLVVVRINGEEVERTGSPLTSTGNLDGGECVTRVLSLENQTLVVSYQELEGTCEREESFTIVIDDQRPPITTTVKPNTTENPALQCIMGEFEEKTRLGRFFSYGALVIPASILPFILAHWWRKFICKSTRKPEKRNQETLKREANVIKALQAAQRTTKSARTSWSSSTDSSPSVKKKGNVGEPEDYEETDPDNYSTFSKRSSRKPADNRSVGSKLTDRTDNISVSSKYTDFSHVTGESSDATDSDESVTSKESRMSRIKKVVKTIKDASTKKVKLYKDRIAKKGRKRKLKK